jgi:SAM-dependent methyltransferase
MQSANCLARDFYHRDFAEFCQSIGLQARSHRKLWEFGFIWHHLCADGAVRPGARGVGFGVGRERFPSLFAKHGCKVLATDAPPDTISAGWTETDQYSGSVDELFFPDIVSEEAFRENVRFEFCDMNAIGDGIRDYDFCWSSCSFEHLGSIENGLDFVVTSVEKVLKPGGIACHTSELNLSSNDETLDNGATVLFRRRDIEKLIERLESRGHKVKPLPIEPAKSFIDLLVDLPPYDSDLSLRLKLGKFVTTSFGIVISRGAS